MLVQHESGNIRLMEPVTPATLSQRDTSLIILTPHKRLTLRGEIMAKYISRNNTVSARSLKRRPLGTVVRHHNGSWEDVCFTRVHGGWLREREDFIGLSPVVVSSASVANECNHAFGCRESWAKVY